MNADLSQQIDKLKEQAIARARDAVPWIVAAVAILVVLYILRKVILPQLTKKSESEEPERKILDLEISAAALPNLAPPRGGPKLYIRDVPVRVAAIVVAPVGRAVELPPLNRIDSVLDAVVPGLAGVVAAHKPVIRKWNPQVSAQGFAATFFGKIRLPGREGKGSPWCAAAGVSMFGQSRLMVGLVLRAAAPTGLGQTTVDDTAQWLELLRVEG